MGLDDGVSNSSKPTTTFVGGGLKFKGSSTSSGGGGISKKTSKKKSVVKKAVVEALAHSPPPVSTTSAKNSTFSAGRTKTEAELRFEETQRRRAEERAAKMAEKSHKDRVADFNKYLSGLSDHYDIPRVGPG